MPLMPRPAQILVALIVTNGIAITIVLLPKPAIWPKSLFGYRNKYARTIRASHLAIGAKRQPYLRMPKRATTAITSYPQLACDNYI
jgi:hypothetical protein